MAVGILTFHDGINYGAYFQTYSLYRYLLEHGYDCEVINYKNIGFTLREYCRFLNPLRISPKIICKNVTKIRAFKQAHKRLNLSGRFFRSDGIGRRYYDAVIIGSDEVWNYQSPLIGYDPTYFSRGVNAGSVISYAASFGSVSSDADVPKELALLLMKFQQISVRDDNSAAIVKRILKRDVMVVLDPAFLVNILDEAVEPTISDYILVYGFFDMAQRSRIRQCAKELGKKTVAIAYDQPWCDISLTSLTPFEWLGYFRSCSCVITTMYHGMIYSIINRKPFCMYDTPYRRNKVGSLLGKLELSEHYRIRTDNISDVVTRSVDYNRTQLLLEAMKVRSEEYLLQAVL